LTISRPALNLFFAKLISQVLHLYERVVPLISKNHMFIGACFASDIYDS